MREQFGTANRLKLGLFGANMSSGTAFTAVPERWQADWAQNVAVAQLADAAGIDFLLPVARWKGYGGQADPAGISHETIAWAIGLLAKTQRIHVFATVHAPLVHPVFAAKQFVTADHIGEGRFALNVVVGWNEDEFEMFGIHPPPETRYPYAREWLATIRRLWTERQAFDVENEHLHLRGLRARPLPYGGNHPLVLNAGMSPIGQDFAIQCCDGLFSTPPGGRLDEFAGIIADVRRRTAAKAAHYPVLTSATVICRPTPREAEDFLQYVKDNADLDAVDHAIALRRRSGKSIPQGDLATQRAALLQGYGDFKLVGDPDGVAHQLARLADCGVDGVAMIMVNQANDLPYFLAEVEPRLRRLGLRQNPPPSAARTAAE